MIRFYVIRLPPTYTFSLVFFFLFLFSKFLFIIYYSSMKSFLNLLSFFLLSYYLWELYKRTCGALLSRRNWGWEWLHSKFQTFINGSDQWPKNLRFCPLHESMDSYNMLTWPRRPIIIGTYINNLITNSSSGPLIHLIHLITWDVHLQAQVPTTEGPTWFSQVTYVQLGNPCIVAHLLLFSPNYFTFLKFLTYVLNTSKHLGSDR